MHGEVVQNETYPTFDWRMLNWLLTVPSVEFGKNWTIGIHSAFRNQWMRKSGEWDWIQRSELIDLISGQGKIG
jgi:hypothetical protein